MYVFAQKPKATQQTTFEKPTARGRCHFVQGPELRSAPRWQRTLGNQAVRRTIGPSTEDGKGGSTATIIARLGHNFGKVPVVPPNRVAGTAASENDWGIRPVTTHHPYTFSAAIRRASPAPQHDSMNADEQEPAAVFEVPATPRAVALPARSGPEPKAGEAVLFPSSAFPSIALPPQRDRIASNFGYDSSINPQPPPAHPTQFGETTPFYEFAKPGPRAVQTAGKFDVTGTILANITFWVAGGTRTNIASDSDPAITQANYPTVVSDLTPSPAAVHTGGLDLYKNQSPRTKYWAEDLTIIHEGFHADEDVKFGQEGVTDAQNWLNTQTAANYDQVGALLNGVAPRVARWVDQAMALPGREQRAYDHGAADYLARARAINRKGAAKEYLHRP
jgi:hypothetical protein